MAVTRLLDLTTLELCDFPISQMPPYLAVSHVWSEGLFTPSHQEDMESCEGLKVIQSLLEQRRELSRIRYCWVDTWSIDQDDADDKARQILLMGSIYKQAQLVVVAVKTRFSFTQADWDLAIFRMGEAFGYVTSNEYDTPEARACCNSPVVSESFARVVTMLDEITMIPWFRRVWTAQEYILAKDIMWIGSDRKCIRISPGEIRNLNKLSPWEGDNFRRSHLNELVIMSRIRTGHGNPTAALRLASHRGCLFPEDEIYGLMAASEVVIAPLYSIGVEMAWQTWWEKAIMSGHIMWAMMRVSDSGGKGQWHQGVNCIMPSFDFRFGAIDYSGVDTGVRPHARVELHEGTLSVEGRIAGNCKIDTYLGELKEAKLFGLIQDVVSAVSGDVEIVTRFCTAASGSRFAASTISAYATWACDEYRNRKGGLPMRTDERQQVPKVDVLGYLGGTLRYGKTYLGTLENQSGSANILVNTDEVPEGELLALDIGTNSRKSDTDKEAERLSEHRVLMIVHVPPGQDPVRDTLHKVGTTSDVTVPAYDKVRRANKYHGIVLEDNFERYRIGGASCSYCRPLQTSDTPKPVAVAREGKPRRWTRLKKWAGLEDDVSSHVL